MDTWLRDILDRWDDFAFFLCPSHGSGCNGCEAKISGGGRAMTKTFPNTHDFPPWIRLSMTKCDVWRSGFARNRQKESEWKANQQLPEFQHIATVWKSDMVESGRSGIIRNLFKAKINLPLSVDILQEAQDSNALLEDSVGGLMSEMEKLQQERLSILQQAILCCFVSVRFFGWFFSNVADGFWMEQWCVSVPNCWIFSFQSFPSPDFRQPSKVLNESNSPEATSWVPDGDDKI